MAIKIGGAPLGRPALSAADVTPQRRSLGALVQQEGDLNSSVAAPEVATYDPRDLVYDRLRNPELIPEPDTTYMPEQIQSMEDVAAVSGSPYAAATTEVPVLDDAGNMQVDPMTGAPIMRTVTPQDFNSQYQQDRANQLNIASDINAIAQDPSSAILASESMLNARNAATESGNTRAEQYGEDYIARVADESSNPLTNAVLNAKAALLSPDARVTMEHMEEGMPTQHYAAGMKILFDAGIDSPEDRNTIATVFGVAASKANMQVPTDYNDKAKKASRSIVRDHTGNAVPDGMFFSDYVNSIKHFASNGLKNAGVNLEPKAVEQLAKVMAQDAIEVGDAVVVHDPNTGRPYVTMSEQAKENARALERMSEVMLGDQSRGRSSTTPNPSGAGLLDKGQLFTAKSFGAKGLVTTAAEAVKDIMGRIGTVFRQKDVMFADIALGDVAAKVENDPDTGYPLFSHSAFADRYGVGRKHYDAAHASATLPENLRSPDAKPENVESFKRKHAAEVMRSKFQAIEFDMQNIEGSPGVRFTKYMHSLSNQRMFPANFDTDYMSSKNVIRDTMGLAKQDTAYKEDLFNATKVQYNQQKFDRILRLPGDKKHEALMSLSPREQGAIGLMYTTVVAYYTTIDPQPEILKTHEADVIRKYRPEMASKLAALGKQYNEWLLKPDMDADIVRYLAAMERGESMGAKNLWDDLHQLETRPNGQPLALTHHNVDDGTQNGIFLQSLFFGSTDNAIRLGVANPKQEDLRGAALNKVKLQLDTILKDDKEKLLGMKGFLAAAEQKLGRQKMANVFFKAPLMQNAYSKHASVFRDYPFEVMEEYASELEDLAVEHLDAAAPTREEAYGALGAGIEATLGEIINAKYAQMMKSIGRYTAILDTAVFMEGLSGDTSVFSPPGLQPVNKSIDDSSYTEKTLPNGQKVYMKLPNREVDTFRTPNGDIQIESTEMTYQPSFSKGTQMHLKRRTKQWDLFQNALGTSQSRMMAVMPIQAMDGDLLKWTTLFVNRGLKTPVPALWVHDSIISTPFGSLVYRNAYNNVAIRNAIPKIADYGRMFDGLIKGAEQQAFERARSNVNQFGTPKPVGIGESGDFPALGAFFDEIQDRLDTELQKRAGSQIYEGKPMTKERLSEMEGILKEARSHGWVSSAEMPRRARQHLAVSPKDFEALVMLSKEYLRLAGPKDQFRSWVANFDSRVKATAKNLLTQGKFFGNTLFQMSPSGGTGPLKSLPKWQKPTTPKDERGEKHEKRGQPKPTQYKRVDNIEDYFDEDSMPF